MNLPGSIFDFLIQLGCNNNRKWFQLHKSLNDEIYGAFKVFTKKVIERISEFGSVIRKETSQTCMFRIYRDLSFLPDKIPYKAYFGICIAYGGDKSSLNSGYYIHIQSNVSNFLNRHCPCSDI